ncbi:hypothetical protein R1flu_016205 [Riccia fluitans]|uniref:Uncharacterized protein n=1 Tax=Riccia fluitans TaxID=41844 RepID=A0ABD1YL70_9MARC
MDGIGQFGRNLWVIPSAERPGLPISASMSQRRSSYGPQSELIVPSHSSSGSPILQGLVLGNQLRASAHNTALTLRLRPISESNALVGHYKDALRRFRTKD